jgi:hypothetical protein
LAAVKGAFVARGFSAPAAADLAKFCFSPAPHRGLPVGASTSPGVSNLVLHPLDERMAGLCRAGGITYTRYADDLFFSSPQAIPEKFRRRIAAAVRVAGFRLNAAKQRLQGPRCRKVVAGLVVNARLNLPRKLRRSWRALAHRCACDPMLMRANFSRLQGIAGALHATDPAAARTLAAAARRLPAEAKIEGLHLVADLEPIRGCLASGRLTLADGRTVLFRLRRPQRLGIIGRSGGGQLNAAEQKSFWRAWRLAQRGRAALN